MPALDFPTSPTNGQVYGQYTYDSTKGAWRVTSPSTVNNAIISPTAPPSPVAGNIWYNSTDGNTYVYYDDGNTSQWVQLKSDATLSSTLGNRVTSLESYPSGLVPVIPTSVSVTSGSASVSALGRVSIAGASSITLQGIFSSTYTAYRIEWHGGCSASSEWFTLNWMDSAGAFATNNYDALYTYSTLATGPSRTALTNEANGRFCTNGNYKTYWGVDVYSPFEGLYTTTAGFGGYLISGYQEQALISSTHKVNASYTGVRFTSTGGTVTGTLRIYGYRE